MIDRYSLHKVVDRDDCPFSEEEYSWFKFGDKHFAEKFAAELFDGFIREFGERLLLQEEIIILPSPYLSIPTASNFLCLYFKRRLNAFLFQNNKKACLESKIYRNQTYVTDYGNLDFKERVELISNDTYYIDRHFIDGKFCIFVDDIKITGSHEFTVKKILDQYNIDGEFVFVYLAELLNTDIHPNIENHYNYFAVKGVNEIIEVINRADFQFNTRIIKYILNLEETEFRFLVENIPNERKDELFHLAISNNYHQITEYKTNINSININ
jgi:hypothetical protein